MENVHCYDLFTDRWWRAVFSVSQGLCVPDYRMCIAVSSLHNSSFIQWDTQHIIISEMCTVTLIPNAQCTIVGSQIYSPIHLLFVFIHFTSVIFIIKANTMIIKAESFHPFMKWHIDFLFFIDTLSPYLEIGPLMSHTIPTSLFFESIFFIFILS